MSTKTLKVTSYIDLILARSMAPQTISRKDILDRIKKSDIAIDDDNLIVNKNIINKLIYEAINGHKNNQEAKVPPAIAISKDGVDNPFRSLMIPRVGREIFDLLNGLNVLEENYKAKAVADRRRNINYFQELKVKFKKSFFKNLFAALKSGYWDFLGCGYVMGKHNNIITNNENLNSGMYTENHFLDSSATIYLSFIQRNDSIISFSNPRAKITNIPNLGRFGITVAISTDTSRGVYVLAFKDVKMLTPPGYRQSYPHVFAERTGDADLVRNKNVLHYFCLGNQEVKIRSAIRNLNFGLICNIMQSLLTYVDSGASPHVDISAIDTSKSPLYTNHHLSDQFEKELKECTNKNDNPLLGYIFDTAAMKICPKKRATKIKV